MPTGNEWKKPMEIGLLIAVRGMILVTGADDGHSVLGGERRQRSRWHRDRPFPRRLESGPREDLSACPWITTTSSFIPVLIIRAGTCSSRAQPTPLLRSMDASAPLNEFTIAFEDKKPQGVLTGTGGESDELLAYLENRPSGKWERSIFDARSKIANREGRCND